MSAASRFYRADRARARDTGGSGLGLAIVQRLVAAQGGFSLTCRESRKRMDELYFTVEKSQLEALYTNPCLKTSSSRLGRFCI